MTDRAGGTASVGLRAGVVGLALLAFASTVALRALFLDRSYDVFVDEITYYRLGANLLDGQGVSLFGVPFLLHPPAFFILEAAYLHVFEPAGGILQQVYATRFLNVILAGVSAVAVLGIGWRAGGRHVGVVAATLFAIEPFVNRMNSRLLLETGLVTWVLLGFLILLTVGLPGPTMAATSGATASGGRTKARIRAADFVTGLFFGLAVLTKDMAFFVTLLPIGICWLTGQVLPRRRAAGIGIVAIGVYALYPIGVTALGLGSTFVEQKFHGLLRFAGVVKETGFVRDGQGPTFIAAVMANLDVFVVTYVLMAIAVPGVLILLHLGDRRQRMIAIWTGSAYLLLGYSLTLGTLEEQFFYLLVVPALVTMVVASRVALDARRSARLPGVDRSRLDRPFAALSEVVWRAGTIVLILALGWSGAVWVHIHTVRDDSYARLLNYLEQAVPAGRVLGVTNQPQHFIIQNYVIEPIASVADIQDNNVEYVVLSTKQVASGYTEGGREIRAWLQPNADLMISIAGRSYGALEVWMIRSPTGESSAGGTGSAPPSSDGP